MNKKDSEYTDMFRSVFDATPSLVFVVDNDVRTQAYNAAAAKLLLMKRSAIIKHRGGDVLHCIHATDVPEGCDHGPACQSCVIRNAVSDAFHGNHVVRRRAKIEIIQNGKKSEIYALINASPFRYKKKSHCSIGN